MNKTVISIIVVIIFLGLGLKLISNKARIPETKSTSIKNISVTIGEEKFDLVNGVSEKEITPGSATKNKLMIFGEPVMGDLDKDGDQDSVLLLVNEPGGSGTFYYAVLAINNGGNNSGNYVATNAMLLGDRIAPQTVEIRDGRAIYNFAERKAGEPFVTPPSVGKSVWIHFDKEKNEIGEWVKDFEGEADSSRMTLGMKDWYWIKTEMSDGKVIVPRKQSVFYIKFGSDGKVEIHTDCNNMGGGYSTNKGEIIFSNMYSTKMYCENSQETEFSKSLNEVQSFMFTGKGELVLMLKYDSGSMVFK